MKGKSKQALWTRRVQAFEVSGQSRAAYCRRQGLSTRSLDYWRRRLAAPAFVPIQVTTAPRSAEALFLACAGGARLQLPRDCDPAWLAQLLSGLR